jgi:hypothetical protein
MVNASRDSAPGAVVRSWRPLDVAALHESRLLIAANPALFALLTLGRFIGPVRKVPRLRCVSQRP